MEDIIYMLNRIFYAIAVENNDKPRNVLQSVYLYLKSIHGELSKANGDFSYVVNCIDMPDLDVSGMNQKEKSVLRDVADVMSEALPTIFSLNS